MPSPPGRLPGWINRGRLDLYRMPTYVGQHVLASTNKIPASQPEGHSTNTWQDSRKRNPDPSKRSSGYYPLHKLGLLRTDTKAPRLEVWPNKPVSTPRW